MGIRDHSIRPVSVHLTSNEGVLQGLNGYFSNNNWDIDGVLIGNRLFEVAKYICGSDYGRYYKF